MSLRTDEKDTYDWVKVVIDCDQSMAEYHVIGCQINGKQNLEEDMSEWSLEEIQECAGNFLNIIPEDYGRIEVEYR